MKVRGKVVQIMATAIVPALLAACSANAVTTAPQPAPATAPYTQAAMPDFTRLVREQGPAVVNISSTMKTAAASGDNPLDKNDPLYEFFRRFRVPVPPQGAQRGIGSGFIVSPDGYILTNAHVVDGAKSVQVKLTDRREFTAKVIGTDQRSDVALIKIDATNLPVVRIGHSRDVEVGQWVVAVGSPFGFENSVTAGIVSATSRSLGGESYVPFIQTDVAVNPGSSGGPLFDLNGNVIGINSQIYSRTGGYMGLSFAVPIDVAMHVEKELQAHGKVSRSRIGVSIQSVNQSLAASFGLPRPEGALVSSVEERGPAARAGLKPGDVILAWNGTPVTESSSLPVLVADTPPGNTATVRIWRDNAERNLNVTVAALSDENNKVASSDQESADRGRLGVAVRTLTPEERSDMHMAGGVVVEDVEGAAASAGLQQGDIILSVNDKPVRSAAELRALVERSGKHVALLIQREDSRIFVPVDIG